MRIAVLGPLEVSTDDGRPIAVPGGKERLLLAVLAAAAPGVVSTDRILESLWDGPRPASARKSLQVHLVHLRSALEPDRPPGSSGRYVVRRGAGYALEAGREDVDALRLHDLAARGRAHLAAGDPAEAARLLGMALDLWRGEPYDDWPDASFADPERRRLSEVRKGALTALLEARLALGEHHDVAAEAERLLSDDPLQEEWWRLLVLALYRCGRQGDALAAVARARAILVDELGVEPGPRLRAVEAAVLDQDPSLDGPVQHPPVADARPMSDVTACPYKGLATYQAADAGLFHGRTRVVTGLVARLVDATLIVVSGASGAGKSSLVRAGLVPALAAGALPGSAGWRAVVLTPGRRPVDALAGMTGPIPPDSPVVLVCDQLEELWAPGVDRGERTAFLDTVLGLIDDGIVARCVAVLRGDHVGRLAEHAAFTERLGGALVLVPPLTDGELREVVNGPAAAVGMTAETELLDAVVADLAGRPAALPLLSTALVGTWERHRGARLTLAGYLETGGVTGALARSAEDAYGALDGSGREGARRLLVRLADVDDGGALVRRPVPLAELDLDGAGGAARRQVVETFVRRRLLSVDGDRLEVAHEALLTAWPRLARWLEDDAAGRAVRRHLAPAAREWDDGGRPDDELFRGARLAAALDWAAGPDADPTPLERQFLDASRVRAEAELDEAREHARREAAARHSTRRLAAGLAAVLVVAVVAAIVAVRSRGEAERTSVVADANRLAALSATAQSLDQSFLLAAQAVRLAETPDTQDALLAELVEHRRAARAVPFPGSVRAAMLGDGGRTLFIGAGLEIVTWRPTTGRLPEVVLELTGSWLGWRTSAVSPTEPVLAAAGSADGDSWVRLVHAEDGEFLLLHEDTVGGEPVALSFTRDGALLDLVVAAQADREDVSAWRVVTVDPATGARTDRGIEGTVPGTVGDLDAHFSSDGATVVVRSVQPGSQAMLVDLASGGGVPLATPHREVEGLDVRALSTGAAHLWSDGKVTLYDRMGRAVQELDAHRAGVADVVVSPDGTWAATVGGTEVVLWDIDPVTGRWVQRESLAGHTGDVVAASAAPDGRTLYTVSLDDTVIAWDLESGGGFGAAWPALGDRWITSRPVTVQPNRSVVALTRPVAPPGSADPLFDPATHLVSASFLDPRSGDVVAEVELGETVLGAFIGGSVAVSPDGRQVAASTVQATTILDVRTHEVVERIVLPSTGDAGLDGRPFAAGVVISVAWTPDGRLLIGTLGEWLTNLGGRLLVVDAATWEVEERLNLGVSPAAMEPSPDQRWIAVASANTGQVVVLDAGTLEVRHTLELNRDDWPWDVSFSPDGEFLAVAGQDGFLYVADTETWDVRVPVAVNDEIVTQLEWLPDGRTVAAAGFDRTVTLFDVETARVRATQLPLPEASDYITFLMPGPEDELVVAAGDRPGHRYPMNPSVWLREACSVVGRDLTRAEWDRYLPGREYEPTCSDLG